MTDYNGWTNHATWEVYNIIANTEAYYNRACGLGAYNFSSQAFAAAFRGLVKGRVNWAEIAEAFSGEE